MRITQSIMLNRTVSPLLAIISSFLLIAQSAAQSLSQRPYTISLTGDTTFFSEVEWIGSGEPGDKVKTKQGDVKTKTSIKELKGFGGLANKSYSKQPVFSSYLILPDKEKEGTKPVVQEKMASVGHYLLAMHLEMKMYSNGNYREIRNFYLFKDGKWLQEVEKDNFAQVLNTYFTTCTGEKGISEEAIKFKDLEEWCYAFRQKCGQ